MVRKAIITVSLLVFVLVAGALIYINTNLNAIVKSALERYGSDITQTDVVVKDVDISLASGTGSVSGFHIGNPKSFFAAKAIDIGSVSLQIDTGTVTGDGPLIIKEIIIDQPDVDYEINAAGNANLQALQQNISSWSGGKKAADESGPSRNVIIKDLYIRNGKVSVTHSLLQGREVTADLPVIHLTNIGEKGHGATPQEVAAVVLGAVVKKAAASGEGALQKELLSIKNLGGDAAKGAKDTVEKTFKNLF